MQKYHNFKCAISSLVFWKLHHRHRSFTWKINF